MTAAPLLCRMASPAARAGSLRSTGSSLRFSGLRAGGFCSFSGRINCSWPASLATRVKASALVSREQFSRQAVRRLSDKKEEKKTDQTPQNTSQSQTPPPKPPLKPAAALLSRVKSLTPHENIYTVPNILTFSRLAAAPVIGYLVLYDYHAWAIGLFAYAGITDLVDGWIARTFKQQTVVGTVIDPMADKTLMTVLTVALALKGALPAWCATIIIGRDVGLAISAIYYRYISLPPPKTLARYWDFSLPSAEVHPTGISKINTALQLGLIGWTVCMPMLTGFGSGLEAALAGMQYLVATTTIWSGLSYVYTKDAVKILTEKDIEERRKKTENKE